MPNITIYITQAMADGLARHPVINEEKGRVFRSMIRRKLKAASPEAGIVRTPRLVTGAAQK